MKTVPDAKVVLDPEADLYSEFILSLPDSNKHNDQI